MDTKLIQRYGEAILSYRMRTARQKIRMQYEDFDKDLIQLDRQEGKLYQQKKQLGWQTLDKPYQRGWIRFFILRQDMAAGRHAIFFEGILKKINVYQYNRRKDFKERKRKSGKKIYVGIVQNLLKLNAWEFHKMEFTDAEKRFFNEVWQINTWDKLEKRYEFKYPGIFVLTVAPFMVEKVKVNDAQLESDIKMLENYFRTNDYRKRQGKILRGYYKYKWRGWKKGEKIQEENIFKDKPLVQTLDWVNDLRYDNF